MTSEQVPRTFLSLFFISNTVQRFSCHILLLMSQTCFFLMWRGNEPNTVKAFVDRILRNGTPSVKDWPPQSLDLKYYLNSGIILTEQKKYVHFSPWLYNRRVPNERHETEFLPLKWGDLVASLHSGLHFAGVMVWGNGLYVLVCIQRSYIIGR